MSKCIMRKLKNTFMHAGLAMFAMLIMLTMSGCGSNDGNTGGNAGNTGSSDGGKGSSGTPAKFFRYTKAGNPKDGEYIVIHGLNTKCDLQGNLEVNLDDIWNKFQGNIVIPDKIDSLTVKIVEFDHPKGQQLPGGIISLEGKIQDPDSLYLVDASRWMELITKLNIPDNVSQFSPRIRLSGLEELSMPSSCQLLKGNFKKLKKLDFREVNGKKSKYSYSGPLFEILCDDYNCSLQSITLPDSIKLINLAISKMKPSETGFLEINCASDAKFFFCTYDKGDFGCNYTAFSNIVSNDPVEILQSIQMTSAIRRDGRWDTNEEKKGYEKFLQTAIASRLKINGKEMPDVKSCMSIIHDKDCREFTQEASKFHESIGIKKDSFSYFLYGK